MNDAEVLAYVKTAAALMRLPLDEARAERVAAHLARTATMAADLEGLPLDVSEEPAEMYCPAPFPLTAHGHAPS